MTYTYDMICNMDDADVIDVIRLDAHIFMMFRNGFNYVLPVFKNRMLNCRHDMRSTENRHGCLSVVLLQVDFTLDSVDTSVLTFHLKTHTILYTGK